MIVMVFEVWPKPRHRQDYRHEAARLRPRLNPMNGFLSIDRFESLSEPGKRLSPGFFRDDDAVRTRRNRPAHGEAQRLVRLQYFDRYRLRIGSVTRDHDRPERGQAPADSVAVHD